MILHRTAGGVACLIIGAIALLLGALLTDAARLLDPDAFADRAAASLGDERVAAVAAERLTDALLVQRSDLTAVRPLLLAASRDVVRSSAFKGVVRTAARRAHGAVFSGTGRSVVLSIPDVEVVLRGALAGSPAIAGSVPGRVGVALAGAGESRVVHVALRVMQSGRTVAITAWLSLALGALLLVAGVMLMRDRRDALVGAGAALIACGLALRAAIPVGEAMIARLSDAPESSGALAALWSVGLAGLPRWGLMYVAIGVVLAAAGSSLLERVDLRMLLRRVRAEATRAPRHRSLRLLRGGALAIVGLLVAHAPAATLAFLASALGIAVAFAGLREVFAVVLHAAPADARLGRAVAASGEGWAVGGVLVLLLAGAFIAAIALTARTGDGARGPTSIDVCNGAAELCDRRLDEVVFAGTHNSMASSDQPGWMFPQQERGIVAQLGEGVRAFLVDVHYGTPVGGVVRTEIDGGTRRAEAERLLGVEGTAAAMRIRDRLVGAGGTAPRRPYLCHGFCELGAAPLDSVLGAMRAFLVQHPNEVVLLVVEDYVSPADLARSFEASGLAQLVYRGSRATTWPTLRELIARDERVVVLTESGAPDVPWLLPAFQVLQETPYRFSAAADTLSCAPNRGGVAGRLLLVNHWIETTPAPLPSNAARVNTLEVLLERARRCERARGRAATIIAVDFYRTGDLLQAARVLNGVGRPAVVALPPDTTRPLPPTAAP